MAPLPLQQKRALTAKQAKAPRIPKKKPAAAPAPPAGDDPIDGELDGGGAAEGPPQEVSTPELVEQAAQDAEAGKDPELEDVLVDYDAAQHPPAWATNAELWEEAVNAVQPDSDEAMERYQEPYVVCAYVYKALGGEIDAAVAQAPVEAPAPEGQVDEVV